MAVSRLPGTGASSHILQPKPMVGPPMPINPLVLRLAIFGLVPTLVCAGLAAYWITSGLPARDVRLTRGVTAPVVISRDSHGVPHIVAKDLNDAAFAAGYAQAQDRMWQLELQRRTTAGRMAEVLGREALESDIWYRTLDLRGSATQAWQSLSPAAQQSLTAFSAGVNARLRDGSPLPLEFQVFGITPEPWSPLDSLAWMKAFALDLGGNMDRELEFAIALKWLGAKRSAALFPGYHEVNLGAARSEVAADPITAARLSSFRSALVQNSRRSMKGAGSNAWAVSGRWTGTGAAMLANDPHLGLSIPSVWYAQSVRSPTWVAAGMAIVGTPMIIFGRNDTIAWAGTNMMADAQDLVEERISDDGKHNLTHTGWQVLTERIEAISVRPDWPAGLNPPLQPVRLRVRSTANGPLITDVVPGAHRPLALRWTGLDRDDTSYEAFFRINLAQDWVQFRASLQSLVAPALNFLFADQTGRIGFQAAGRIPVRSLGNGNSPVPGWSADWRWTGEVPRDTMPANWDPAEDVLVSANQAPANAADLHLSSDWASPARAQRISTILTAIHRLGRPATIADMSRIQSDMLDLDAVHLMQRLRPWLPASGADPRLIAVMDDWQGAMAGNGSGPAIFRMWTHFLRVEFAELEAIRPLPGASERSQYDQVLKTVDLRALDRMLEGNSSWCVATGPTACAAIARRALRRAQQSLIKLTGESTPGRWRLNQIQAADYAHISFGTAKPLDWFFSRRIGSGGSENSISVASSYFIEKKGFRQNFGAGFRQIMTLSPAQTEHWYMLSTGQSGIVASAHYADMIEPFHAFKLYRLGLPPPLTRQATQ